MSEPDRDNKKAAPGRASPDVAFRRAMDGISTRCSDLAAMLDNGDFGQVAHTAQSAVNLWLTARIACRRLDVLGPASTSAGDTRQFLESGYTTLLDLLKRAHTLIDRHEIKNTLDNLRITLVGAMTQTLNGS
jgi:hypothetical protein